MNYLKVLIILNLILNEASADEKNDFSLGAQTQYYSYSEKTDTIPEFMSYKGGMIGAHGHWQRNWTQGIFSRVEGRFLHGLARYWSKGTGTENNISQNIFEPRVLLGTNWDVLNLHVSPYIGFGYRYKSDDSSGGRTTTGHSGYKRQSHYYYVPLGMIIKKEWEDDLNIIFRLEFDWLIKGENLSAIKAKVNNIPVTGQLNHKQNHGYGLKGEILMSFLWGENFYSLGPYLHYWKIQKSNNLSHPFYNYTYEPHNTTLEAGLKIQINF